MEIRLRRVEENDAHLLFRWRNEPEAARNSLNNNPLEWIEHKAWLDASLNNPKRHIMIGMIGEKHPVGMIRFDELIDGYEVSIIVDPYLRTRGMGKALLQEGIKFFSESIENGPLYAIIRGENVASLIIFLSSGFKLVEYTQNTGLTYLKKEPK